MSRRRSLRSYFVGTKRSADVEELIVDLTADSDDEEETETSPSAMEDAATAATAATAVEDEAPRMPQASNGKRGVPEGGEETNRDGNAGFSKDPPQNDDVWQGLQAVWKDSLVNVRIGCKREVLIKSEPGETCRLMHFDEDEHQALRQRCLSPRVRKRAELAGGMTLRRQARGPVIDLPGFEEFRSKIDKPKGDDQATCRILLQLRDWEKNPMTWPWGKASNDDEVMELVDLSSFVEPDIVDVEKTNDAASAAVATKQESNQPRFSDVGSSAKRRTGARHDDDEHSNPTSERLSGVSDSEDEETSHATDEETDIEEEGEDKETCVWEVCPFPHGERTLLLLNKKDWLCWRAHLNLHLCETWKDVKDLGDDVHMKVAERFEMLQGENEAIPADSEKFEIHTIEEHEHDHVDIQDRGWPPMEAVAMCESEEEWMRECNMHFSQFPWNSNLVMCDPDRKDEVLEVISKNGWTAEHDPSLADLMLQTIGCEGFGKANKTVFLKKAMERWERDKR